MNRSRFSTKSQVMGLLLIGYLSVYAQEKQSWAILDLEGEGVSPIEATTLTHRLRSELVRTKVVTVVERAQMQEILLEQDFQLTGCVSEECIVEVGRLLGVTAMVAGYIGKIGATFTIELRSIDVQTGVILETVSDEFRGDVDQLLTRIEPLAWELVGRFRPEGKAQPSRTTSRTVVKVRFVIGEGMGMTHDAALSGAKRDAVEKGVGVVLVSETSVKNFQVERDKILSKANGFVKTYEELSSSQGPNGLWAVRISAQVTAILDELVKDQLALDLLLSWVRHPRFMIVMDEVNIDDTGSTVAETEIGRIMGAKGFDIISSTQIEALRQRNVNLAEIQGDPLQAAGMAAEFGAEYIIMGNASAMVVTHPMLGSRLSGQANISTKVVRADNAQIIAQETFHGKSTHIDGPTAGVNALKQAAGNLAGYLMVETVRKWSLE